MSFEQAIRHVAPPPRATAQTTTAVGFYPEGAPVVDPKYIAVFAVLLGIAAMSMRGNR